MSISTFTQKLIKILRTVQEIGHFHFFRIWRSAKPRTLINVISQYLRLALVNINVYANFYQTTPNGLRVIDIFHELSGDKIFTNALVTNPSQTVRGQNKTFDYRSHSESQPSVSVDFLRVVQSVPNPDILINLLPENDKILMLAKILFFDYFSYLSNGN